MALTNEHHHIARLIHTEADKILKAGKDNSELLMGMIPYMDGFKKIMDNAAPSEMDALSLQYPGFYEYAKLLENIAQDISDGTIKVP
jgi:hypothetical protein